MREQLQNMYSPDNTSVSLGGGGGQSISVCVSVCKRERESTVLRILATLQVSLIRQLLDFVPAVCFPIIFLLKPVTTSIAETSKN